MGLTRRTFIQQTGLALTALGLSEAGLSLWADRYQQAIAQPTRRKLALLIGINQYPEPVCDYAVSKGNALNGSVTDVALQQELLVHRFGFQASDILTLTDQQATRRAIVDAFQTHLIQQARPGDVVVFHFSGLGSRIRLEDAFNSDEHNYSDLKEPGLKESGLKEPGLDSLVPVDGWLPTPENPVIQDFSVETLAWLLRSLSTDQVTTVLDTSYTSLGRTLQGNLRIRSRPNTPSGRLEDAEERLQQRLSRNTGISRAQIQAQWRSGQLPGLLLSATRANQIATEAQWNGFSAGLFTYALTQQLWWTTPAVLYFSQSSPSPGSFNQVSGAVWQAAGVEQQPYLGGQNLTKLPREPKSQPSADQFGETLPTPINTDGVIHAVDEEGKVQIWLAGLPAAVLENYGASVLAIAPTKASPTSALPTSPKPTLLQIRSREGLMFKARLASEADRPLVGQWVQEQVRLLPRNVGLTVAIDASLKRIERVDATSAFSAIPRVSSVIAGEQPADFLFGKNQPDYLLTASLDPSTASSQNGYGLFYPGRNAILSTLIQDDEAVKTAVNRVTPELKTLLAAKLLRLTENCGSSGLAVQATLEQLVAEPPGLLTQKPLAQKPPTQKPRSLMQQRTVRAVWTTPALDPQSDRSPPPPELTLSVGSQVQYRLANYSDRPLYFVLLGLNPAGNAIAFYPGEGDVLEQTILAPGETLTIPPSEPGWKMQTPGLAETYIVLSCAPLTQTYQALATARPKTDIQRVVLLAHPLEVVQALLQDLHQASLPFVATLPPKIEIPADMYAIEVNAWATLSFVYQVV